MRRACLALPLALFAFEVHAQPRMALQQMPSSDVTLAAADKTQGMALMSAVLDFNGNLVRGSGVKSTTHVQAGQYRIVFNRSIANCAATANAATTGTAEPTNSFYAVIYQETGNSYRVHMTNPANLASMDASFHMIVFCPE